MAAAFAVVWLVVSAGFACSVAAFVVARKDQRQPALVWLLAIAIFSVPLVYLVVKLLFEEIYPCVFVDQIYCDFSSTRYHNLFGWEF
jgi:Na+-driven multidrug efflux pump